MGFTSTDTINGGDGSSSTTTFTTTRTSEVSIKRNGADYVARCHFLVYRSEADCDCGCSPMKGINATVTLTKAQLATNNVYADLYTEVKTSFTATTDVGEA